MPGAKVLASSRSGVYVALAENGDVKIGMSGRPGWRLTQLRRYRREPIQIVYSAPLMRIDAKEVERAAHKHFASNRLTGEWFRIESAQAVAFLRGLVKQTKSARTGHSQMRFIASLGITRVNTPEDVGSDADLRSRWPNGPVRAG